MENCECGNCCKNCPLWKKLTTDPRYLNWAKPPTRTIGGRKQLRFRYLPKTNEFEIDLPNRAKSVANYPKKFTERHFKIMCCRFSFVTDISSPTKNQPGSPSTFVGNNGQFNKSTTNPPGWASPAGIFSDTRKDPPFVVAVVRRILEDNHPALDHTGYCPCQNNCK